VLIVSSSPPLLFPTRPPLDVNLVEYPRRSLTFFFPRSPTSCRNGSSCKFLVPFDSLLSKLVLLMPSLPPLFRWCCLSLPFFNQQNGDPFPPGLLLGFFLPVPQKPFSPKRLFDLFVRGRRFLPSSLYTPLSCPFGRMVQLPRHLPFLNKIRGIVFFCPSSCFFP